MPNRKEQHPIMRSGFEDKVRRKLDKAGMGYKYEHESFQLSWNLPKRKIMCDECGGHKLVQFTDYTPDFFLANGIVIETKGRWDKKGRDKAIAMIAQHPDVDYRMLFMRDNTISKNSKTKYSDICEKQGIPYAVGMVPEEWLE